MVPKWVKARFTLTDFIKIDMRLNSFKGLYVITDCEKLSFETMLQRTKLILETGVPVLQYRDKTTDHKLRHDRALVLKELCSKYQTIFLINDDVELAIDIKADGVHIGKDDLYYEDARRLLGDNAIIGISCYNDFEKAKAAQTTGANYVAFGAFFSTQTKNKTTKAEPGLLRKAKQGLSVPVIAIGGITPDNSDELVQAGADMLAVVSSLYDNDNPQQNVLKFNELFQ